ncbi:DUF2807 domain-containing protein [Chryseobacterium sp. 6424]|uniref:GIN domain-containing protein n=1 Tax=Chryseobacterium sp. 6424 TaxID=2039166 RepID=UPI000EFBBC05|nr:DUF2807 domain-containing protein [Chryseobacterium sp. 6424]AYO57551.1 DUF2807 domain-containing protein [Chryseobacterium sp. 6424]
MKQLLSVLLACTLLACGKMKPEGEIESKDFRVEDFVNLDLKGKFRLFYVKSDSSFVNVETYPNILNNLNINVKDQTLSIAERRETRGTDFYNVTVYSKYDLQQVSVADSVEINISSEINTDNFRLNLKNNSKFIGSVKSRRAEVDMSDKSLANFLGSTENAVLKIADSASLLSPYWLLGNLTIDSKNGNYAEVNVRDSLKGTVKNTAKMIYYNDPIRAFKIDPTAQVQHRKLQ